MKNILRVLCLEDSVEDYTLTIHVLKKRFSAIRSERVDTKEEFIRALSSFNPSVILSDHSLPQFDSLEALKLKRVSLLNVPFILVTGAVSDEFAVRCLKLGADDYVLKQNLKNLPSIVVKALKAREDEEIKAKASEELGKQNEELIKVNKDLDAFVYSVSHNLRSPLNSLQGLLNLSKGETDPSKLKLLHAMMEKSIQRMDQNVVEVLEYARNAKQELAIEKIDLEKLILENFEKMQFMQDAAGVVKEVTCESDGPFYSDRFRISNVINNLISNSIKYQDPRKDKSFIKVNISINKDSATIKFQDNGIVIPRNQLNKVFDMFYRATEVKTGIGLGLYIVKEAVQILKGEIKIRSVERKGTTFTLVLPNWP